MINGFPENSIERQMQLAAIAGKVNAYFSFFHMLENAYEGDALRDIIVKTLFLNHPGKNVLEEIISQEIPSPHAFYIVEHILSLYRKYNWNLDNFATMTDKRVYAWAGKFNHTSVLDDALVKEEMLIDEVKALLLANNLNAARKILKKSNISMERVFYHQQFFQQLLAKFSGPQNHQLDTMMADLVSSHELPLHLSNFGYPINLATVTANYPKLAKTDAFRALDAISTLATESYADEVQHPVATRMIDEYLENVDAEKARRLATILLGNAADLWGNVMPGAPASPHKEAIILQLLNYGAEVPFSPMMMHAMGAPFYNAVFEQGMSNVVKHPNVIADFKKMSSIGQKMLLEQAGQFTNPAHVPTPANVEMVKTLIPFAKQKPLSTDYAEVASFPCMTLESFIGTLNTWSNTPHDPASHQRKLEMLGLLLKHEMIEHIESVTPGSHALSFNNPQTAMPYDLHAYMMDNPSLKAGFLKPQRDVQLLSLYGLTKGLLSAETRNAQVLEKVRAREAVLQRREDGTAVVTNRYDIKPLMQSASRDVRALIMSFVDPSTTLTSSQRAQTAMRLNNIALEHVDNSTVNIHDSAKYIRPAAKK